MGCLHHHSDTWCDISCNALENFSFASTAQTLDSPKQHKSTMAEMDWHCTLIMHYHRVPRHFHCSFGRTLASIVETTKHPSFFIISSLIISLFLLCDRSCVFGLVACSLWTCVHEGWQWAKFRRRCPCWPMISMKVLCRDHQLVDNFLNNSNEFWNKKLLNSQCSGWLMDKQWC